jgi:phospholipase A1
MSLIFCFALLVAMSSARLSAGSPPVTQATQVPSEAKDDTSAFDRRMLQEDISENNPFAISPYQPMYFMPVVYSTNPNQAMYEQTGYRLNDIEVEFQVSFKLMLWPQIIGAPLDLQMAYTQISQWQLYNGEASSPFRETNYQPEFFLRLRSKINVFGAAIRAFQLSLNHQSNGRSVDLSRSWNRVLGRMTMERNNFYWILTAWYRIPQPEEDDDNPDILDFWGNGDLRIVYMAPRLKGHSLSLMFRPAFRNGAKVSLQLEWNFPLVQKLRGYVQFFTGYGPTMIDYNHQSTRIGAGLALNNWL